MISSIEVALAISDALAALAGQAVERLLEHLERQAETKDGCPLLENRASPLIGSFG